MYMDPSALFRGIGTSTAPRGNHPGYLRSGWTLLALISLKVKPTKKGPKLEGKFRVEQCQPHPNGNFGMQPHQPGEIVAVLFSLQHDEEWKQEQEERRIGALIRSCLGAPEGADVTQQAAQAIDPAAQMLSGYLVVAEAGAPTMTKKGKPFCDPTWHVSTSGNDAGSIAQRRQEFAQMMAQSGFGGGSATPSTPQAFAGGMAGFAGQAPAQPGAFGHNPTPQGFGQPAQPQALAWGQAPAQPAAPQAWGQPQAPQTAPGPFGGAPAQPQAPQAQPWGQPATQPAQPAPAWGQPGAQPPNPFGGNGWNGGR